MAATPSNLLFGIGVPAPEDGVDNDHYINTENQYLYRKVSGEWQYQVALGGVPDGVGTIWLEGAENPAAELGEDGNFYLNTVTQDVFKKASGTWDFQGDWATVSSELESSSAWLTGTTAPAPEDGVNGNYWRNSTNNQLYFKAGGIWSFIGVFAFTAGATGTIISQGTGVPASENVADYYLNLDNLDVYQRVEDAWVLIGSWAASQGGGGGLNPVGQWDMSGAVGPLLADVADGAVVTKPSTDYVLTISEEPASDGAIGLAGATTSGSQLLAGTTGIKWAKFVPPAIDTENDSVILSVLAIYADNADFTDLELFFNEANPVHRVDGLLIQGLAAGLVGGALVNNNTTSPAGGEPIAITPGDSVYVGIDFDNSLEILVQINDDAPVSLGNLNLSGSTATGLKVASFVMNNNAAPFAFGAGSFLFNPGTVDGSRSAFSSAGGDAVVPEGAVDFDIFEVTVGGTFGGVTTQVGDFAMLYDDTSKIIVTRLASSVGSHPTFRGEIDLTPSYTYADAVGNSLINCTQSTGVGGIQTLTPVLPLAAISGFEPMFKGFGATATDVVVPTDVSESLSFLWPDLTLDSIGAVAILVHDNNQSAGMALSRLMASAPGTEAYVAGVYAVNSMGTPTAATRSVSGTAAPGPAAAFTIPTAGQVVILTLGSDGSLNLHTADNSYNEAVASFPIGDLPPGTSLGLSLLFFTNGTTTNQTNLQVDFASELGGAHPFQSRTLAPVVLPEGTVDGDTLLCIGTGPFGGKEILENEYFILINNTTEAIVIPDRMTPQAVSDLIDEELLPGGSIRLAIDAVPLGLNVVGDWNIGISGVRQGFVGGNGVISGDVETGLTLTGTNPLVYNNLFGGYSAWAEGVFDENSYPGIQLLEVVVPSINNGEQFTVAVQPATGDMGSVAPIFSILYFGPAGGTILNVGGSTVDNDVTDQDSATWRVLVDFAANTVSLLSSSNGYSTPIVEAAVDWAAALPPVGVNVRTLVGLCRANSGDSAIITGLISNSFAADVPPGAMDSQTYRVVGTPSTTHTYGRKPLQPNDFATFYNDLKNLVIIREGQYVNPRLDFVKTTGQDISGLTELHLASTMGEYSMLSVVLEGSVVDGSTIASLDLHVNYADGVGNPAVFKDGQLISVKLDCTDHGSGAGAITALNIMNFEGSSSDYPPLSVASGDTLWLTLALIGLSNGSFQVVLVSSASA